MKGLIAFIVIAAAAVTLAQHAALAMPGEMPDLAPSIDAVRTLKAVADRAPDHAPARAK